MKIGILTYHWVYNFGANLQVYVLTKILEKMGHEVKVLNYKSPDLIDFYNTRVPKEQREIHDNFLKTNLNLTKETTSENELRDITLQENFDGIIVGSDSLWRVLKDGETSDIRYPNVYWMNWIEGSVPIASLSVSTMGTMYPRLPNTMQKEMLESLKKFEYISVRDSWSKWMLQWISKGKLNPTILPDPVFAANYIDKKYLIDEALSEKINQTKYFICSMYQKHIDDEEWNLFKATLNARGYKLYELPHPEGSSGLNVDFTIELPISPKEWFTWFHFSSGYIGEKFHPIVVSLANNKPFISIDNYTGNRLAKLGIYQQSKIYDILKRFGLTKSYFPLNKRHKIKNLIEIIDDFPQEKTAHKVEEFQTKFLNELTNILNMFEGKK